MAGKRKGSQGPVGVYVDEKGVYYRVKNFHSPIFCISDQAKNLVFWMHCFEKYVRHQTHHMGQDWQGCNTTDCRPVGQNDTVPSSDTIWNNLELSLEEFSKNPHKNDKEHPEKVRSRIATLKQMLITQQTKELLVGLDSTVIKLVKRAKHAIILFVILGACFLAAAYYNVKPGMESSVFVPFKGVVSANNVMTRDGPFPVSVYPIPNHRRLDLGQELEVVAVVPIPETDIQFRLTEPVWFVPDNRSYTDGYFLNAHTAWLALGYNSTHYEIEIAGKSGNTFITEVGHVHVKSTIRITEKWYRARKPGFTEEFYVQSLYVNKESAFF